jgi:1-acyl-sn-glycerol-3-phosphate acyltransferase
MQNIIIDKPYQFVPPHRGTFWLPLLRMYLNRALRKKFGIVKVEHEGVEHLKSSIAAGHAVMLCPNHCRDCDPLVLGPLTELVNKPFFIMASWHLFMQSRMQTWMLHRAGAFSIYREGMDRAALNAATEILETAERPLVLFPEGVVSRSNYRLNSLMEGAALIARSAAKKRAKLTPAGKVVIHPIAIHYKFHGDITSAVTPTLDEIESRLSWCPQHHLPLLERIYKLGQGLLSLKEIEYLGQPQTGTIEERLERLIDALLVPLEKEWLNGDRAETVVARVKRIRIAILPDMVKGDITEDERKRRWRQLADVYLAQQLAHYPSDYIQHNPTPERILETMERIEEDLTDRARAYSPMSVKVQVGPPIEVSPTRESRGTSDPVVLKLEESLKDMLGIRATEPVVA